MTKSAKAGIAYTKLSWRVMPLHTINDGKCTCLKGAECDCPGKHPRIKDWPNEASSDPEKVTKWFTQWPDSNVGIATGAGSGFIAIDIDPRHDGEENFNDLQAEYGQLPNTVEALTGGGGRHLLFKHPGDIIRNRVGNEEGLAPGIDVRADGGLIVVSPSIHISGNRYEWEASSRPDEIEPAELPEKWLNFIKGSHLSAKASGFHVDEKIPQGCRNDTIYKLACSMYGKGLAEPEIMAVIRKVNSNRCMPPLTEDELEKIIQSVQKYAPGKLPVVNSSNSFNSYLSQNEKVQEENQSDAVPYPEKIDENAFHGIAGKIVKSIIPYTEADEAALLLSFLTGIGNVLDNAFLTIEATRHHLNIFCVLVGESARGRKGTSWNWIKRMLEAATGGKIKGNILTGLSSGEGLIYTVRDPLYKKEPVYVGKGHEKHIDGYLDTMVDEGIEDKRRLIIEEEFVNPLKVMAREGNTLSSVIRSAWDHNDLRMITKNNPYTATNPHISMIGHITRPELVKNLKETDALNGFANRFLWLCVRRSKILPFGGTVPQTLLTLLAEELQNVIDFAQSSIELSIDNEVRENWGRLNKKEPGIYQLLTREREGYVSHMVSRAEAQVLRLASLYAVLDMSNTINIDHMRAALAVWQYCEASAEFIFGTSEGDPVVDRIFDAISGKSEGLTQTEISKLFSGNMEAKTISNALQVLSSKNKIICEQKETTGRPKKIWKVKI